MSLPRDLVEMLSEFAAHEVRYLVIGGHAVSLHARPRATKDLDVWLDPRPDNITRVCAALSKFGVPRELIDAVRGARVDEIVWMGRVPARVDFLQSVPALTFEACWARRLTATFEGVVVQFVGRDDLIANKRAVGRPQDRRDVRALEAAATNPSKRQGSRTKKST